MPLGRGRRTIATYTATVTEPGPIGVELTPANKIIQFSLTSSLKNAGAKVDDTIVKVADTSVVNLDNTAVRDLIMSSPRPLTLTLTKPQTAGRKNRKRKTRKTRR